MVEISGKSSSFYQDSYNKNSSIFSLKKESRTIKKAQIGERKYKWLTYIIFKYNNVKERKNKIKVYCKKLQKLTE